MYVDRPDPVHLNNMNGLSIDMSMQEPFLESE